MILKTNSMSCNQCWKNGNHVFEWRNEIWYSGWLEDEKTSGCWQENTTWSSLAYDILSSHWKFGI